MKWTRSCPCLTVCSLLLLVLSACGPAAPATSEILPTVSPPTAIPPPADTPTPAPTPTLAPPAYPPQRAIAAMVYDSKADTVFMFGGSPREFQQGYDDAWSYQTSTNTWTPLSTSPMYQKAFSAEYDGKADKVAFYFCLYLSGPETYSRMGETYVYDPNTDKMEKVTPKVVPYGFMGANMVYDSESDRFILFGGVDIATGQELYETWAYDLNSNTWTAMNPAKHPAGRNWGQMAYIPTIDRVLLFSGWSGDATLMNEPTGDTWLYDYNHDTWEQLGPSSVPARRHFASMVYMSSVDRVLLYGGRTREGGPFLGDLWTFNPTTRDWEELHPATDPGERGMYGMTYDSKADKVVLFGGGPNSAGPYTDETWLYDPQANTWTNVTPQD